MGGTPIPSLHPLHHPARVPEKPLPQNLLIEVPYVQGWNSPGKCRYIPCASKAPRALPESLHGRPRSGLRSVPHACSSLLTPRPGRVREVHAGKGATTAPCSPHPQSPSPRDSSAVCTCFRQSHSTPDKREGKWGIAPSTCSTGMTGHRDSINLLQVTAVIISRPCSRYIRMALAAAFTCPTRRHDQRTRRSEVSR